MKNLVSIEKKIFLKKENLEYWHYDCAYEMIEVCEFCLSDEYTDLDYLVDDVKNAEQDWIENNYNQSLPSW